MYSTGFDYDTDFGFYHPMGDAGSWEPLEGNMDEVGGSLDGGPATVFGIHPPEIPQIVQY